MRAALAAVVLIAGAACGASPTSSARPASNAAAPNLSTAGYIAMVRAYWTDIQAADGVANGVNVAAAACLGGGAGDAAAVDPVTCRERAVAILAAQQKFRTALGAVSPPRRFATEDAVLRIQVPRAISAIRSLIDACATGDHQLVLQAAGAYVDVMVPTVTDALDQVDPTVRHT